MAAPDGGDAIRVDLEREYNGTVSRARARLDAIRDVSLEGRSLHARADDGGFGAGFAKRSEAPRR